MYFSAKIFTEAKSINRIDTVGRFLHLRHKVGVQVPYVIISIQEVANILNVSYNTAYFHIGGMIKLGLIKYSKKRMDFVATRKLLHEGNYKVIKTEKYKIRRKRKKILNFKFYDNIKDQIKYLKGWDALNNEYHQQEIQNIKRNKKVLSTEDYSGVTCRRLAEISGKSHTTANKRLKELEELGLITIERMLKHHEGVNQKNISLMKKVGIVPQWAYSTQFGVFSVTRNRIKLVGEKYPFFSSKQFIPQSRLDELFNAETKQNILDPSSNYIKLENYKKEGYITKSYLKEYIKRNNLNVSVDKLFRKDGYTLVPNNNPNIPLRSITINLMKVVIAPNMLVR